jgi:hypothetical protein
MKVIVARQPAARGQVVKALQVNTDRLGFARLDGHIGFMDAVLGPLHHEQRVVAFGHPAFTTTGENLRERVLRIYDLEEAAITGSQDAMA